MANCPTCSELGVQCKCSDGVAPPRHPIYDALDAHLEHGDFPDERNTKAAAYYLASQIAELMQRVEKLEKGGIVVREIKRGHMTLPTEDDVELGIGEIPDTVKT